MLTLGGYEVLLCPWNNFNSIFLVISFEYIKLLVVMVKRTSKKRGNKTEKLFLTLTVNYLMFMVKDIYS